ncbi:M56 family metallopeptidase [Kitasatospora sp. NPDC049285]|uniref:M56 family metallopeptidase n=1 Tax=Kitasatospora sp. NPDC049285 TaxID=3157096 RepID=UPI00344AB079
MIAALALLGYALVVGVLAPLPLARAGWTHRAPRLAVALWQGLALSFLTALVLAAHHLAVPGAHLNAGLVGLLHACGVAHPTGLLPGGPAEAWRLLPAAAAALWPLGWFAVLLRRTRRHRRRHREVLDLVAAREPGLGALVLEHAVPAAYCLPGRRSRIVLTRGALDLLTPDQIAAVLAHERAHVAGRHHLARTAADALAKAFPFLPLARLGARETALLLEMAADDRAVRRHPRTVLAAAMYRVADGQVPHTAFAAGGPDALVRVRRLLTPAPAPHPALRTAAALTTATAPILPLLLTCTP